MIGENEKRLAEDWFKSLRDVICQEFEDIETLHQKLDSNNDSKPGKFEQKKLKGTLGIILMEVAVLCQL